MIARTSAKRILFVSYYFPPISAAGTQRILRFVHHLPKYGWEPIVLTVSATSHRNLDFNLMKDIDNTEIYRTRNFEPGALQFAGTRPLQRAWWFAGKVWERSAPIDAQIGWVPFAARQAKQLIQNGNVQAIFTSGSPFSSHLVGLQLGKDTPAWIADFRDPLVGNPYRHQTPWRLALDKKLEEHIVRNATRTVLNTPTALETYQKRYPMLTDRLTCITNSFDSDLFSGFSKQATEKFSFVHCGDFYAHRTPRTFLEGFRRWVDADQISPRDVEVIFVGGLGKDASGLPNARWVEELQLDQYVRVVDKVPYSQSLEFIFNADVLLLISSEHPQDQLFIPSKLFDYLASGNPVLGIVSLNGPAATILSDTGNGLSANIGDPTDIAKRLSEIYYRKRLTGNNRDPIGPQAESYTSESTTSRLAAMLEEIT